MARNESTRNVFNAGEGLPPRKRSRVRKDAAAPVQAAAPTNAGEPAQAPLQPPAVETSASAHPEPARAFAAAAGIPSAEVDREQIARLAHSYWEARGCQGGSPEEDWLRAEQELRRQRAK